MTIDDYNKI